jgi:uncharacterized protein
MPELQFLYRIQPTRPAMLSEGATDSEAEVVAAHFAYLKDLTERGTLIMAGRTLTADSTSFGLVVLEVDSEGEALALMEADPAVAGKVMHAKLFPFRVALMTDKQEH